ncbi:hypothetical protein CKY10_12525 [Photorhabdus sp. HUG-39]|uniref:Lipoprotein n=1 Tax=Photorhabdus kayaii TaxID=230088 RepID=A0ABX0B305_9GAMM|nr:MULTISPECIES: hypothetical protein [Photorhabdus]MCC8376020.1 hypothetical protein [Photorhabdus bodei]NDL12443.1 hypothetical protein [Photorhabdus kayaii]NDL26059.1 hypothetical protein [Photorhabdus kayaii]RAX09074.1 hypothetical protein CKY10_12525 [Photorhabdus sp. HUG-39]
MINIKKYLSILSVILISSCANPNEPLSPPKENQWITVEGVVPKYTEPYVSAVYISKDCLEYQLHADMSPYKVPTYNGLRLKVKADPQTGYFQTKLPFNGGGRCKWKIDRAFVSVRYTDVSHLMKDVVNKGGNGTGLTAFINDATQTNLSETAVLNTLDFRPVIYPILKIVEGFPKRLFLRGEVGTRFFQLKLTPGAEWKIIFKPKLDETKIPKITVTKKKEWVEYPDGSIKTDTQQVNFRYIK